MNLVGPVPIDRVAAPAISGEAPARTASDGEPLLSVEGLQCRFGDRVALAGVGFSVGRGEILGLLGPNGAGKTTVFRILSGLLAPGGGRLLLGGRPISPSNRWYRAKLGVVFQEPSVDLKLTGRENLRLGASLHGMPGALARRRVAEALELAELGGRADELVSGYSGGMRRRLELARVLIHDPELLILDEPGRGVDPDGLRRLWSHIQGLRDRRHLAVVVTTHLPEEAERCDRIVVLDAGRVVASGTPESLRAQVAGDVVRIEGERPDEIAAAIRARLSLPARLIGSRVLVEAQRGHEVVPRVVELFPAGQVHSVATSRPTLADVFAKLTGHGLADGPPAQVPQEKNRRPSRGHE